MQNVHDMNEYGLREVFRLLLRKWYVILITFVLATGAAIGYVTYTKVPIYVAETTLFWGNEQNPDNKDDNSIQMNNSLAVDYREILKSKTTCMEVIESLGIPMSINQLRNSLDIQAISNSRFISITFTSTNQEIVADVANKLAEEIIVKAKEILNVYNVKVMDRAERPVAPVKISETRYFVIGAIAGLVLGIGLILLLDFFDNKLRKEEDVEKHLDLKVISSIPKFDGEKRKKEGKRRRAKDQQYWKNLITHNNPKAPPSEAYRMLRTNLQYYNIDKKIKTLVITSPGIGEGKSTTAANLAIALAQVGKKTLLIDADLRKPCIHKYFDLFGGKGLTSLMVEDETTELCVKKLNDYSGLFFLASGPVPPNPAEILSSNRIKELLEELKNQYDILIIDTPPVAQVTDASILGGICDSVLLVISSGKTNIEMGRQAKNALKSVNSNIIGVVLAKIENKTPPKYYKYYNE